MSKTEHDKSKKVATSSPKGSSGSQAISSTSVTPNKRGFSGMTTVPASPSKTGNPQVSNVGHGGVARSLFQDESPAKVAKTSTKNTRVSGYIVSVTGMKLTRTRTSKYFNFYLQESENKKTRGVCFDANRLPTFHAYRDNGKPVVLDGVVWLNGGFNDTRPDDTIKIERKTVVCDPQKKLSFERSDFFTTIEKVKNSEIHTTEYVDIKTKVLSFVGEARQVTIYDNLTKVCRDAVVADATGAIRLVLWEAFVDKVQVHTSYTFSDVKVKFVGGTFELTTTPSTDMCRVEPLQNVFDADMGSFIAHGQRRVEGTISAATIKAFMTCSVCGKGVSVGEERTFKCPSCGMRQRSDRCERVIIANIVMNTTDENTSEPQKLDLTASKDVLKMLLPSFDFDSEIDAMVLEDELLFLDDKVDVTFDTYSSRIMSAKQITLE